MAGNCYSLQVNCVHLEHKKMCLKNKLVTVEQPYFIAETTMPGKNGFDLNGASQSFNVLAEYLFGKVLIIFVIITEKMKAYQFC